MSQKIKITYKALVQGQEKTEIIEVGNHRVEGDWMQFSLGGALVLQVRAADVQRLEVVADAA